MTGNVQPGRRGRTQLCRLRSIAPVARAVAGAACLSSAIAPVAAAPALDPAVLEQCEDRVRAEPDSLAAYLCFNTVARRDARYRDEAIRRLEAKLSIDPADHLARVVLAAIEAARGNPRAETLYREAAAGFARDRWPAEEVRTRINLAAFLGRQGRSEDADQELDLAEHAAERAEDAELVARVLLVRLQEAYRRDELSAAWRLAKRTEAVLGPEGSLALRGRCSSFLGAISTATGRSDDALRYHRQHAEIERQRGDPFSAARALGNVALQAALLWGRGMMERAEALPLAEQALQAAVETGNRHAEGWARHHLGTFLGGRDALQHYEAALAIGQEIDDPRLIGMALRSLALQLVREEGGDLDRARALIDEATRLARSRGDLSDLARAQVIDAEISWTTTPGDEAVAASLRALEAIEAVRDLQPDDLVRARFLSNWAFAYLRLSGRLLEAANERSDRDRFEAAFAVIERMRARVLLEALDAAGATGAFGRSGALGARRQTVLDEIAAVQRRLVGQDLPDADRADAVRELERLELDERAVREEIARIDSRFAAIRQPRLASLRDAQSLLGDDEAIVSFQLSSGPQRNPALAGGLTDGGSWALVVTRGEVRADPLPNREAIEPAITAFAGLVRRGDDTESDAAGALSDLLFEHALARLPTTVHRLVVIPDGELHRLPLAALRRSGDGISFGSRYEISIAPSVTAWQQWRLAQASAAESSALVLADPEPPAASPAGDGPQDEGGGGAAAEERAWALVSGVRLGRLPHARAEARGLLRHAGGDGVMLLGDRASEAAVKQEDLARYGIVHFAVHAILDDEQPERSSLLLAPGADDQDGLLQIREIVDLDLTGSVVVLSACRSASGEVLQGEGVVGLARAFFQAGARAVVGSLWPLRDDDAAALFDAFYRHLAAGASLDTALRDARRDRIRAGAPASAWAGVVLLGDGTLIPWAGGRRSPLVLPATIFASLGLLALIAFAAWRRSARRTEASRSGFSGSSG